MSTKSVDEFVGSIREGVTGAGVRVQDVVENVAEKVEHALDEARVHGQEVKQRVQEELVKRWKVADRVGRENAFIMAGAALVVGIAVGFLIARDRD